jgi:hypothetical protein
MEWGPSCIGYFAADVGYVPNLTPRSEPECLRPPGADMTPHRRWAAMCHKRLRAIAANYLLFDHLVGAQKNRHG